MEHTIVSTVSTRAEGVAPHRPCDPEHADHRVRQSALRALPAKNDAQQPHLHAQRPDTDASQRRRARQAEAGKVQDLALADVVHVVPWHDPALDEPGYDARSWYVERFWLPVLGPSTTWLLRNVARRLEASPEGFDLVVDDTARELGLGFRSGRNSPLGRSLARCIVFGVAQRADSEATVAVRPRLPRLAPRHLHRLPARLQAEHDQLTSDAADIDQLRQRARVLACSLVDLGESLPEVERQLVRWRVHPALAREAAAWASQRKG